jgi:nucleotide-binding universal stress UspA family protein
MTENRTGRVLVGVDDSEGSAIALDYALDEAVRRGWTLRAVLAYEEPSAWITAEGLMPPTDDLYQDARKEADRVVEAGIARRRDRGLEVPTTTVEAAPGSAASVLTQLSGEADLLVVGHRGRGAAASRLIGSVGLSAVVHAACTVIVVRA